MGRVRSGAESLQTQLEDMRRERDRALAELEKLSLLYEADRDYWLPIVLRLNGSSLQETLDDYDNLKERLAGNMGGRGHISNELVQLRQVAEQVWANADPCDTSTHPKNEVAASHLIKLGWKAESARRGAILIRPGWARKGRPEEC